jgi:hypothetical protein
MKKYLIRIPDGNEYTVEAVSEACAKAILVAHFKQEIHQIMMAIPVQLSAPERNYCYLGYDKDDQICGKFTQSAHSRDEALLQIRKMLDTLGIVDIVRFELKDVYKTDQSIVEYAPGCYTRI